MDIRALIIAIIAVILLIIFCSGCATTGPSNPLPDQFAEIYAKEYEKDVYDCSNKSCEYALALLDAGYHAEAWIIDSKYSFQPPHCVVMVVDGETGKRSYHDVTNNESSWRWKDFGRKVSVKIIQRRDLTKLLNNEYE